MRIHALSVSTALMLLALTGINVHAEELEPPCTLAFQVIRGATIALKMPTYTQIRAHKHREDRSAVVVSGVWYFGIGMVADCGLEKPPGPGSFST
jgi:hypothetical protein